jgi:PucR C-terminal helix-turn-helix domain/GGDEF-like domain/Purine catabolism regulatory protein-like family
VGVVTARDVRALLEQRGARLVAGAAGLDRPITWASAMRARPPAFESLQGDELALLSLATLRTLHAQDDTLTLDRLIQDLAEHGVSAMAVAGLLAPAPDAAPDAAPATAPTTPPAPGWSAGEAAQRAATPEEIALADALALPLVTLPSGTQLSEVERDIIARVARRSSAEPVPDLDQTRVIYDALMRASLRGEDDRALGHRLAAQLGVAVALEDAGDVRWCVTPAGFPLAREALEALLRRPSSRAALLRPDDGPGDSPGLPVRPVSRPARAMPLAAGLVRLAAPLEVWPRERPDAHRPVGPDAPAQESGRGLAAYLCLVAPDPAASAPAVARARPARGDPSRRAQRTAGATRDALSSTLERVAPLFALALARRQDLAGAERRLRADTLDALLAGTYPDEGQMRARAAQLGYDLALPHVALVVELGGPPSPAAGTPRRPGQTPLAAAAADALSVALPGAWTRALGAEAAALLPLSGAPPSAALGDLVERCAGALARAAGDTPWSAGLGEPAAGPAEIRRSYREARDAARLGLTLLGPGRVARSSDLGIYRLLLRLRDGGELADFCRNTLGPLTSDARTGDALLETLEVFFACNGNLSEAARRLDLHRNSLIYRLNRARELLGHDLEDSETRLALQLALKARRVLAL